jgi:hypothetical protein
VCLKLLLSQKDGLRKSVIMNLVEVFLQKGLSFKHVMNVLGNGLLTICVDDKQTQTKLNFLYNCIGKGTSVIQSIFNLFD